MGKKKDENKKPSLSARKLEKLKNSEIKASITETDKEVIIYIYVGECLEPSMRHRDRNGGGKYDPLNAYKEYLSKVVMEQLDIQTPYKGEFTTHIKYYRVCNADASELFTLKAYAHEIRPLSKPDNDNVIKTIQDAFNKKIFEDDIQISKVIMEKYFSPKNSTHIRFTLNKEHEKVLESIKGERVNKKIREDYEKIIKGIKEGF